jgi:5'-methylthioadenosine phosphorylase
MPIVGVIAGSGLYEIPGLKMLRDTEIKTPYGEPSAPYSIGELGGIKIAFLPRHGSLHRIPPDQINYRANIWGFKELGAERVLTLNATGGINPDLKPGDIVITDQVIDMTQGARQGSYYDRDEVVHVDFTEPYCPELRDALLEAATRAAIKLKDGGTYICVNGPRLESRAEIRFFGTTGADLVGMTGMPEASLARELELCLASVSVVTNYAAGITAARLTTTEVVSVMNETTEKLKLLIKEALPLIPLERACPCKDALRDARMGEDKS